ncbi:hypothetical protein EDC30_101323 [Paucimonas lemoignei]|uniref:Uncharacterized protein n=2 Tax=Paucimonas lemoignei TaxID=29443 RepID=A0A4R3I0X6_PAULE|nr:hypothetical protein EDC30_101323 [Paucimonas lemoignei]
MPEAEEKDAIHVRAMMWAALAIIVTLALAAFAVYFAWVIWRSPAVPNVPNAPMDFSVAGAMLESAPQRDYASYLAEKQRMLTSYQWVDEQAGIARIPIEEALRLMVERSGPQAAQGGRR